MHPALRISVLVFAAVSLLFLFAMTSPAQAPAKLISSPVSSLRFAGDRAADPTADELKSFGPHGETIEQTRAEVISILVGENSCAAWYRAAEPEAPQKFRSLRFTVDPSGSSEILKMEGWQATAVFYQPYVARAGQNVGWGSTIILNANGAFFKDWAPVRIVTGPHDKGYLKAFRRLAVANFDGATREARILTLLHELGHVLDLLPIDAGVPSGPELSTTNTELVIHHCGAQIREAAKHQVLLDSTSLLLQSPVAIEEQRIRRGTNKQ
jgi:hypothetical protein